MAALKKISKGCRYAAECIVCGESVTTMRERREAFLLVDDSGEFSVACAYCGTGYIQDGHLDVEVAKAERALT